MCWIRLTLLVFALFLMIATGFAGTIYTWTDADGVRRYSNTEPPEGVDGVEIIDEIQGDYSDDDSARSEYDRMVEKASQEADEHFAEQEKEKARAAEAEKQRRQAAQEDRIAAERQKLQAEIDAIDARGLGPTFSAGQKAAMIKAIQEKIDRLESDPDGYFGN